VVYEPGDSVFLVEDFSPARALRSPDEWRAAEAVAASQAAAATATAAGAAVEVAPPLRGIFVLDLNGHFVAAVACAQTTEAATSGAALGQTAPRSRSEGCCPGGHALLRSAVPTAAQAKRIACDECGQQGQEAAKEGDVFFGCRLCDFDLCARCGHGAAVAPPASVPMSAVAAPDNNNSLGGVGQQQFAWACGACTFANDLTASSSSLSGGRFGGGCQVCGAPRPPQQKELPQPSPPVVAADAEHGSHVPPTPLEAGAAGGHAEGGAKGGGEGGKEGEEEAGGAGGGAAGASLVLLNTTGGSYLGGAGGLMASFAFDLAFAFADSG
jgi:hypothetical protein